MHFRGFECQRRGYRLTTMNCFDLEIDDLVFLGVSSYDYERCDMSDDVKIELDATDIKRAGQIAAYPWFASKKP